MFEVRFIKKLSNTEAELKALLTKKSCIIKLVRESQFYVNYARYLKFKF